IVTRRGAAVQLGFVSAILPDLPLEDVLAFAGDEGFACVELMCWPPGGADRRYAGVTHLDVSRFNDAAAERVRELVRKAGVAISALGYYPNPLAAVPKERRVAADHLKKVMAAASRLGLGVVNTFIGRNATRSVDDQWSFMKEVWEELLQHAEAQRVRVGIEN